MTDFVIDQRKTYKGDFEDLSDLYFRYAKFLKQPLELWMFVPCDKDGNVLQEKSIFNTTDEDYIFNSEDFDKYQQAKKRCLFEGFEWNVAEFCDEPMIELEDKSENYFCYDCEDKNFSKDDEVYFSNIEDLIKYNLQLTLTSIKQLGL